MQSIIYCNTWCFNARSKFWWVNDKTTLEGTRFEAFANFHGFEQFILVPHLLLPNLTSCIDLIFTDQPNLVVDCEVHPTLQLNFHHQIVHCKLSLNIEYPLPYERLVWDYRKQMVRIWENLLIWLIRKQCLITKVFMTPWMSGFVKKN